MNANDSHIAEIQGPYGPISIAECFIQKIWLRQNFDLKSLTTVSGKSVKVLDPGEWNHREGPDFLGAHLEIEGECIRGDIEIHFYARDWRAHQHYKDANYNGVVLHVALYNNLKNGDVIKTLSGSVPETLTLLDYLKQDLEAYMHEEALLESAHLSGLSWVKAMGEYPEPERLTFLYKQAQQRWQQKCHYAYQYRQAHTWEEACHQLTLEVFGYRRNREPMSALALKYKLEYFASADTSIDSLLESQTGKWKLAGIRPPSQPKRRLKQYMEIVQNDPHWPQTLRRVLEGKVLDAEDYDLSTASFRKKHAVGELKKTIKDEVLGGALSGSRLDTVIVDAFFPLWAVYTGVDYFDVWFHWYMGDMPTWVKAILKGSGLSKAAYPYGNGLGQGVLQSYYEGRLEYSR